MAKLDTYAQISIAEVVIYSFFLIGAIFLCIKHGFSKSGGWRFLVILALARLIGSSLYLATINDPTNYDLYIGWMVCNGIALGPLIGMIIGLLTRVFESINRQGQIVVKPLYSRLVQILMLVGLILIIVGGTKSTYHVQDDGQTKVDYNVLSKVGMILFIVVYVLVLLMCVLALRHQQYVGQGERRIVMLAIFCMPFILVRVVNGALTLLAEKRLSAWTFLGTAVIMEMIVILACELVGFTLDKAPAPADIEQSRTNEPIKPEFDSRGQELGQYRY